MKKSARILFRTSLACLAFFIAASIATYFAIQPYADPILDVAKNERELHHGKSWLQMYGKNADWISVYADFINSNEQPSERLVRDGSLLINIVNKKFNYLLMDQSFNQAEFYFSELSETKSAHNVATFMSLYVEINIMHIGAIVDSSDYESAEAYAAKFMDSMNTFFNKSIYETILYALLKNNINKIISRINLVKNEKTKIWLDKNIYERLSVIISCNNGKLADMLRYQHAMEKSRIANMTPNTIFVRITELIILKEHELNYRIYISHLMGINAKSTMSIHKNYIAFLRRIVTNVDVSGNYAWIDWVKSMEQ